MANDYSKHLLFGLFPSDTYSIFSFDMVFICMVYRNNLITIRDLLQSKSFLKHYIL